MVFLKIATFVLFGGCMTLIMFAATHPHDPTGTSIGHGPLLPGAQQILSEETVGDGDSVISVWYHSDILIGYLGETQEGVLAPVPLEKALQVETPPYDGFKQEIYAKNPADKSGHRYLGLVMDGTDDMRSRLVIGMQTTDFVPASSLGNFCTPALCTPNSTYSSQIWHVDRAAREVIPAFTDDDTDMDFGIVFERKWTGELHLALKDINSETRLILVPAPDWSHRTL